MQGTNTLWLSVLCFTGKLLETAVCIPCSQFSLHLEPPPIRISSHHCSKTAIKGTQELYTANLNISPHSILHGPSTAHTADSSTRQKLFLPWLPRHFPWFPCHWLPGSSFSSGVLNPPPTLNGNDGVLTQSQNLKKHLGLTSKFTYPVQTSLLDFRSYIFSCIFNIPTWASKNISNLKCSN